LEAFFCALEANADWLRLATLGEAVAAIPAAGPAYLPATAYYEMTRWALPTDGQRRLRELGPEFEVDGANGELVAGGTFRSFFMKYEEANFFHKRVQQVSRRFYEAAAAGEDVAAAQRHLWRAQANDAYWHGIFGGLYLPHLRRGVKLELVRAEHELDRRAGTLRGAECGDVDADGVMEITLKNENVVATLKADDLSVAEFARRSPPAVLADVPARRPEIYHADVRRGPHSEEAGGAKTIHGDMSSKEPGLENFLIYDRRPKRWFLERVFAGGATAEQFAREEAAEFDRFSWGEIGRYGEGWGAVGTLAVGEAGRVEIEKEIKLTPRGLEVAYLARNKGAGNTIYGTEMTLSITSESLDYASFEAGEKYSCGEVFAATAGGEWKITDRLAEWRLGISIEPACNVWHAPLYTVNRSESGYEKVYQGSAFYFWWELAPEAELRSRVVAELI
jgi:alpha-amylase